MIDLPTIEECQEFLKVINRGRVAIDLEPLEYLDFDNAEPSSSCRCLSATNLFYHAGYRVYSNSISPLSPNSDSRVCVVTDGYFLPEKILSVTDCFDDCADMFFLKENLALLRHRMVAAGVVAP
jgi:hypothetical protein